MANKFDTLYESLMGESYSRQNLKLRKHFGRRGFQSSDEFVEWVLSSGWLDSNSDIKDKLEEMNGEELSQDALEDEPWMYNELFDLLPDDMKARLESAAEEHSEDIWQHHQDRPVRYFFKGNDLVKRDTWLVHFCMNAQSIKDKGFTYGVEDIEDLGTSVELKRADKKGGYNFGFVSSSGYAHDAADQLSYGKQAVMFRNAGVKAWHKYDKEEQVVFWGKDVRPQDMVVLVSGPGKDSGVVWSVMRQDRKGVPVFSAKTFAEAEEWVRDNFNQYKNTIS